MGHEMEKNAGQEGKDVKVKVGVDRLKWIEALRLAQYIPQPAGNRVGTIATGRPRGRTLVLVWMIVVIHFLCNRRNPPLMRISFLFRCRTVHLWRRWRGKPSWLGGDEWSRCLCS